MDVTPLFQCRYVKSLFAHYVLKLSPVQTVLRHDNVLTGYLETNVLTGYLETRVLFQYGGQSMNSVNFFVCDFGPQKCEINSSF